MKLKSLLAGLAVLCCVLALGGNAQGSALNAFKGQTGSLKIAGGMVSGIILAIGRCAEDTAAIMLTGVVATPGVPSSLLFNYEALRFYIYYISSQLRRLVGMVFQTPNPLPMSIFKNVSFPLKLAGHRDKRFIGAKVEQALKQAYLWEEVRDRLNDSALALSGGKQ